jgi:hypothetical protein
MSITNTPHVAVCTLTPEVEFSKTLLHVRLCWLASVKGLAVCLDEKTFWSIITATVMLVFGSYLASDNIPNVRTVG